VIYLLLVCCAARFVAQAAHSFIDLLRPTPRGQKLDFASARIPPRKFCEKILDPQLAELPQRSCSANRKLREARVVRNNHFRARAL